MADGANPASSTTTPTTTTSSSVSAADVANANALNQAVSAIRQQLSTDNTAVIAKINAITSAINSSVIGGTTGTTANRVLLSKGTTGFALQASTTLQMDAPNNALQNSIATFGTAQEYFRAKPTDWATSKPYLVIKSAGDGVTWQIILWDGTSTNSGNIAIDCTNLLFSGSGTLQQNGVPVATLNTNTWLQEQGFAIQTLTDAGTISWNLQTQQTAYVQIAGNRTMGTPSNMIGGFTYVLFVQQDGTGSRTLSFPDPPFKWPNGVAPVLSTGANAVDIFTFVCLNNSNFMAGVMQKNFF